MRKLVYLVPVLLVLAGAVQDDTSSSSSAAHDAVKMTALDYIDGYYTGDAERMTRALHPELAKRIVAIDPRSGESRVQHMDAKTLIEMTASGGGTQMYTAEQRKMEVEILDLYENVASVKVVASDWIDYLHVARLDGEWRIINVLWELTPEGKKKFARTP